MATTKTEVAIAEAKGEGLSNKALLRIRHKAKSGECNKYTVKDSFATVLIHGFVHQDVPGNVE